MEEEIKAIGKKHAQCNHIDKQDPGRYQSFQKTKFHHVPNDGSPDFKAQDSPMQPLKQPMRPELPPSDEEESSDEEMEDVGAGKDALGNDRKDEPCQKGVLHSWLQDLARIHA